LIPRQLCCEVVHSIIHIYPAILIKMLSILIPNYNKNITDLLADLDEQAKNEGIIYEILVGDDCSEISILQHYKEFKILDSVHVIKHKDRLGRSANRNFIAGKAKYDKLLFIDSNAKVEDPYFIRKYLSVSDLSPVLVGGVAYSDKPPLNPDYLLRWKYGRSREMKSAELRNIHASQSFSGFNFMIRKEVFDRIKFDERIKEYGHEDTLFGFRLKQDLLNIHHLDNTLKSTGQTGGEDYLFKTRKSLENLKYILQILNDDPEFIQQVKLLRTYRRIKKIKFDIVLKHLFRLSRNKLENHLTSHNPMILLFQFYKLAYYCSLENK